MRCVVCGWSVPSTEMEEYSHCTSCGQQLQYDVSDVLMYGAGGLVKEKRQGQIDMANLIDDHLNTHNQTVMLLEGGTGIGKSYAYLVPSLLKHRERLLHFDYILKNKKGEPGYDLIDYPKFRTSKIYVSTTTIQLQERISDVDLKRELIAKLGLSPEIQATVMKGGANYACLHPAVANNIESWAEKAEFEEFIKPYRDRKHFADDKTVSNPAQPPWWRHINTENCVEDVDKRRCPYQEYCKPNLSNYNVVVVNHMLMAILMANGLFNGKTNYGLLHALIVDEAHSFINSLYAACTKLIKHDFFVKIGKKIAKEPYLDDMILNARMVDLQDMFKEIYQACLDWSKKSRAEGGIMLPNEKFTQDERRITHILFPPFEESIKEITEYLYGRARYLDPRQGVPDVAEYKGIKDDKKINLELLAAFSRVHKLAQKLQETSIALTTAMATFTTGIMSGRLPIVNTEGFSLVPTDIGEYAQKFLANVPKSLFLSATLSINTEFTFMKKQLGLDRPPLDPHKPVTVVEGMFESPFDYSSNGFAYIPLHVAQCPTFKSTPEDRDRWYESMAEHIVFLTEKNQGDAFVLFTARTEMEAIYARCMRHKPANSIVSYIMQAARGPEAEQRYRNTKHAVLFGLKSFWEGVDVPGDKLRMVIITKLPFPIQSDPIIAIESRKAKILGLKEFQEVQIPRMLMSLRQAAGRLIRTQNDKGVVAVLDSRIWTGGNHFKLKSMQKDSELKKPVNPESYGKEAMRALNFKFKVDNKEMFVKLFHRLYEKDPRFMITG